MWKLFNSVVGRKPLKNPACRQQKILPDPGGHNDRPQARIRVFWQDLGHFAWIWAIMLEFWPFCLVLSHIAWIWAILQNLGLYGPQRRRSPEDGLGGGQTDVRTYGRTDGRTDGQIPPVFYRTSSPSGPLPKKELKRHSNASSLEFGPLCLDLGNFA